MDVRLQGFVAQNILNAFKISIVVLAVPIAMENYKWSMKYAYNDIANRTGYCQ